MRQGTLHLLAFLKAISTASVLLREANTIVVRASNVPTPGTSTFSYGHPPANNERILTAMESSWNSVKMEKMTLAESNARKQLVGRDLESIKALELLPRGWIER